MIEKWWQKAVVYQIYPRSFMDSDGDGIGDLNGIVMKLDYLQELGIDVIWLSPCYKSPNADNGYDISDYRDIMEEFGTLNDFWQLLEEAHKRNIRILMDLVVNHTSDEHPWFIESRKSRDSKFRDYYIWRDAVDGHEPNNWTSFFSGSAWKWDEETKQYYLHLFVDKQPDLNWENPSVRSEVWNIMRYWLDKGVDGFRLDVCNLYSKTPGLPDGKVTKGVIGREYFQDGPKIHDYFHEMYDKVISRYPEMMTVGEASGVAVNEAKKYAGFDTHEMNMVFQFEHTTLDQNNGDRWDIRKPRLTEFKRVLSKWQTELDGVAWNSLYLANHDQPRSVSRFGNDGKYRRESAKMLYTMLLTMQGTPYIYQGEEIGMTNVKFPSIDCYNDVEIHNIWQKRVVEGGADPEEFMKVIQYRGRDNARTPMQWDDTENAGFSTGKPWLSVNPNYREINAEADRKSPDSVFNYMKELIRFRHETPAAVFGHFEEICPESETLYVYQRTYGDDRLLVVLNFTDQPQEFSLADAADFSAAEVAISNYKKPIGTEKGCLQPYEATVFYLR
jgi:oligo-1,6-glucosidase